MPPLTCRCRTLPLARTCASVCSPPLPSWREPAIIDLVDRQEETEHLRQRQRRHRCRSTINHCSIIATIGVHHHYHHHHRYRSTINHQPSTINHCGMMGAIGVHHHHYHHHHHHHWCRSTINHCITIAAICIHYHHNHHLNKPPKQRRYNSTVRIAANISTSLEQSSFQSKDSPDAETKWCRHENQTNNHASLQCWGG